MIYGLPRLRAPAGPPAAGPVRPAARRRQLPRSAVRAFRITERPFAPRWFSGPRGTFRSAVRAGHP